MLRSRLLPALVLLASVPAAAMAADPPTIPVAATGVDLPGLITAAIGYLGTVVVAAVAAYFVFLMIRKGLKWAGKIG